MSTDPNLVQIPRQTPILAKGSFLGSLCQKAISFMNKIGETFTKKMTGKETIGALNNPLTINQAKSVMNKLRAKTVQPQMVDAKEKEMTNLHQP